MIKVIVGSVILSALLDTGSVRSFTPADYFYQIKQGDPKLRLQPTDVSCRTVSAEALQVLGWVMIPLKTVMFSWRFPLLVCNSMVTPLILESDFMVKTRMVLDLREGRMCFKFAAEKSFPLPTILRQGSCLQICRAPDQTPVRCQLGKLAEEQRARMHEIVSRYPDVLTISWDSHTSSSMKFNLRVPDQSNYLLIGSRPQR